MQRRDSSPRGLPFEVFPALVAASLAVHAYLAPARLFTPAYREGPGRRARGRAKPYASPYFWCTVLVALFGYLCLGLAVARADEPEPLRVEASISPGLGSTPPTTLLIEAGVATVRQTLWPRSPHGPAQPFSMSFSLTPAELEDLRRAILAVRFFDAWGPSSGATDLDSWDITVRLGPRERRRDRVYSQSEFEPLERWLGRLVAQADLTRELREGRIDRARSLLVYRSGTEVLRVADLGPEIVACAVRLEDPARSAHAAALLVHLPSADAWTRSARDLLAAIQGERRGAALAGWVEELRPSERAAARAAFHPLALAELDASWPRYPSMSVLERMGCDALLTLLLEDRVAHGFEVAERMAETLGTSEKPFRPPGLLETGVDALPVLARLLASAEPAGRWSGAEMSRTLMNVLHRHEGLSRKFTAAERDALERRLPLEVVPALERLTRDEAQAFVVRKACADALDAWDGRVAAASKAATEAAEAKRRATPPPAPPMLGGTLTISGRLVSEGDTPVPGWLVCAIRTDGRCQRAATTGAEGAFRIDGLAEGSYGLFESQPGVGPGCRDRGQPRAADGVLAGTGDLVVRLPGSLVRGRLLDAVGEPVADRVLVATMRDAPTLQGPAYGSGATRTDARGGFTIARLLPGIYDVEVPGSPVLRGASALRAGPEGRTIQIGEGGTIAGRVVDEVQFPLLGASVSASEPGTPWKSVQAGTADRDGAFRVPSLDPSRRYRIVASFTFLGGDTRHAVAEDVAVGTEDLLLRIDTSPRLRLRVEFGDRGGTGSRSIRLTRIAGGDPTERTFDGPALDWRMALEGTWTVSARVRDIDAQGVATSSWVDLGTVERGQPEKTFAVPR